MGGNVAIAIHPADRSEVGAAMPYMQTERCILCMQHHFLLSGFITSVCIASCCPVAVVVFKHERMRC